MVNFYLTKLHQIKAVVHRTCIIFLRFSQLRNHAMVVVSCLHFAGLDLSDQNRFMKFEKWFPTLQSIYFHKMNTHMDYDTTCTLIFAHPHPTVRQAAT